jgi:DNA-binding NarL/FixJ family response regulator
MRNLLDTIRSVARSRPQDGAIVSVPREALEEEQVRASECYLSRRQMEILRLAAGGMSNREIAEELSLAETTIKRHLADTYKKLGVGSRGEAARTAMKEGWISSQDISKDN